MWDLGSLLPRLCLGLGLGLACVPWLPADIQDGTRLVVPTFLPPRGGGGMVTAEGCCDGVLTSLAPPCIAVTFPGISGFGSNNFQATHGQEAASESASEPAASQITSGEGKWEVWFHRYSNYTQETRSKFEFSCPGKDQRNRHLEGHQLWVSKATINTSNQREGPKRLRCSSWHLTKPCSIGGLHAFPSSYANFPPLLLSICRQKKKKKTWTPHGCSGYIEFPGSLSIPLDQEGFINVLFHEDGTSRPFHQLLSDYFFHWF